MQTNVVAVALKSWFEKFEEFKRHSVRMSTARSGQMMPSQAPQRGRGTSNAGIVVLDKTTGEELDIVPKNAARATLRCETNLS